MKKWTAGLIRLLNSQGNVLNPASPCHDQKPYLVFPITTFIVEAENRHILPGRRLSAKNLLPYGKTD
jgi:hypothetical protein